MMAYERPATAVMKITCAGGHMEITLRSDGGHTEATRADKKIKQNARRWLVPNRDVGEYGGHTEVTCRSDGGQTEAHVGKK